MFFIINFIWIIISHIILLKQTRLFLQIFLEDAVIFSSVTTKNVIKMCMNCCWAFAELFVNFRLMLFIKVLLIKKHVYIYIYIYRERERGREREREREISHIFYILKSGVVAYTCDSTTLEVKFPSCVGSVPVWGNSPLIGGWILWRGTWLNTGTYLWPNNKTRFLVGLN